MTENGLELVQPGDKVEVAIALYPGEIVAVTPRSEVVIETTGALIQGDWGFGPSFRATLHGPVPAGDVPINRAALGRVRPMQKPQ